MKLFISICRLNTARDVVAAIQSCEGMQSLLLSGNTVGVKAAEAIAKALETKPEFEVSLSWNTVTLSLVI